MQITILLVLSVLPIGLGLETKYLLSKALLPFSSARKYCREINWSLAQIDKAALSKVRHRAWVKSVGVSQRAIPAGVALLYKKGERCCMATMESRRCQKAFCDQLAPALCSHLQR